MNTDITFCLSQHCDRSDSCGRSYYACINKGIVFDRSISMTCFYRKDKVCEYYIEIREEG